MTGTVKVYEIAEDLKMDTDTVLQKILALNIPVKNKMSKVDAALVDQIKSSLMKDQRASYVEVEVAPGVRKLKRVEAPVVPAQSARAGVSARTSTVHYEPPPRHVAPVVTTPVAAPPPRAPEVAPAHEPAVATPAAPAPTPAAEEPPPAAQVKAPTEPERPAEKPLVAPPAAREPEPAREEPPRHEEPAAREALPPAAPTPVAEVKPTPVAAPEPVAPPAPVVTAAPAPVAREPEARAVETPATPARPAEERPAATSAPEEPATARAPTEEPARSEEKPVEARPVSDVKPPEKKSVETRVFEARRSERPEPTVTPAAPVTPAAEPAPPAPVAEVREERPRMEETRPTTSTQPAAQRTTGARPAVMSSQPAVKATQTSPTPSVTPARKTGIEEWDPVTRTIVRRDPAGARPSQTGPRTAIQAPQPLAPAGGLNKKRPQMVTPAPSSGGRRPPANKSGPSLGPQQGNRPRTSPNQVARTGPAKPQAPVGEMAQHKRVIKIEEQISLQELARRMSLKATEVLIKLIQLGGAGKNINSTLDSDTAKLLADEFGFTVENVALNLDEIIKKALATDVPQDSSPRAPVVTVMGHVDHGKTTLLDAILGMRVAEGEAGGITQEVRAYRVSTPKGMVVFFDTPGHEAFTALRARGAQLTDVAVLVVAADDGVMPTTEEAINHAKAAKVPVVVALNKMDKPDANPERVIQQLMKYDLVPEEYGGDTLVVKVSAKTRLGIEDLLENLALQSEILELKANAKKAGVATVFESKLDKGRGAVARVLVQEGVVHAGDVVLAGASYGRIRAMFDDRGKPIEKAGPSTPVEILGLNEPPTAGDKLYVCTDLRKAQEVADQLRGILRKQQEAQQGAKGPISVEEILREREEKDRQINVNIVVKADAQGAVEGLRNALTKLSTDKVKVTVLHGAVGAITETDVQLAVASRAVIVGFNVRPSGKSAAVAEEAKVTMRFYNVIYEAVDDIKALMLGQLKPTLKEKPLGKAEVRQVFNITKVGLVAGSMVTDGLVRRNARARLVRDGAVKWDGKIASLRRFKEDAKEVAQGFECGISLENTPDVKPGDVIEAYEMEEVAAQL